MAERKTIVLEIKGIGKILQSSNTTQKKSFNKGSNIWGYEDIESYEDEEPSTAFLDISAYAISELTSVALNNAHSYAQAGYRRYLNLQEDYISEYTVSNAQQSIGKIKQLSDSVISGAQKGAAVGGPIGAIVGAAISVLDFGAKTNLEKQQKLQSYYKSLNETNFGTELAASRAGLVNNGRGTEN